jgi:hypothetical protein
MKFLYEQFWDELLEGKIRDEDGKPFTPGTISPLKLLFEFQIWLDRNSHIK